MRAIRLAVFGFTLFISLCWSHQVFAQATVDNVDVSYPPSGTEVKITLSQRVKHSFFTLKGPDRLVIDLPNTRGNVNYRNDNKNQLVSRVRPSTPKRKQDYRIVVDMRDRVKASVGYSDTTSKPTLIIKFEDSNPGPATLSINNVSNRPADIIVAIDAGHGGRDPGSVGPTGTYEKHIVLSISKMLADRLNKVDGLQAVLVRTGDYYIAPMQRPEIAREKQADLLISIHADAFSSPGPRGASVWVLNNRRAESVLGRWLRDKEKQSALLGAGDALQEATGQEFLARTLLDMSSEYSINSSLTFGKKVLAELEEVTKLHKSKPQHASLAVLTAPDIPSILVEVGFISNPTEEKNLNWSKYRADLADALSSSVQRYFRSYPPDNTAWARQKANKPVQYAVVSGDSLSIIAKRHGISVEALKRSNNLSSDRLLIGQKLIIPRG